MARTISATQAKSHFGAIVESIKSGEGDVIIENRGEPQIVMLPVSEYEELAGLRDEKRRSDALARLNALREEISSQNADLTEEGARAFIKEAVDDAMESLIATGKIRYKE